jgi:tetratricopeptide (TPR) repeat protein
MKELTAKSLLINTVSIFILLFLISSKNISYVNSNLNPNDEKIADSLMNLGQAFYNTDPLKYINLLDSAAVLYTKTDYKKKMAQCYQNISFAYQEKLQDFESAKDYAVKSISIWSENKDTLKEANMLKYLGLINGELGKYALAKSNIKSAINKFESKNYNAGIAVSYYDLALVYEKERKYDSCIYYLNLNKDFFQTYQDSFRIFNVNNRLLLNYNIINNFEEAEQLINSNLSIQKSPRVRWNLLLDFYQYSNEFYSKIKNEDLSLKYFNKYNTLKDSLIKTGIYIK